MRAGHVRPLFRSGGCTTRMPAPATHRMILSPWKLVRWSILTSPHWCIGARLAPSPSEQAVIGDREIGNAPAQHREARCHLSNQIHYTAARRSGFFRVPGVASLCGWLASSLLNPVMKSAPLSVRNARRPGGLQSRFSRDWSSFATCWVRLWLRFADRSAAECPSAAWISDSISM